MVHAKIVKGGPPAVADGRCGPPANKGTVHWSKDFVEHLRTVHFALIVVAAALVIAGSTADSARYATALTQILEAEFAQGEKTVSLLGFAIPISQLSRWGALLLISVQLYLWLHLHEFASKIEAEADGWNVAWVGFYDGSIAKIVVFLSCVVLPVSASLVLGYRMISITVPPHRAAIIISLVSVAVSLSLGLLTVLRLRKLREGRPKTGEPISGNLGADETFTNSPLL